MVSAIATKGTNNSSWNSREPWEGVQAADMFTLHNKNYLCIVYYRRKFPVIKKTEDLLADSLIPACKIISSEFGPSKKIISDGSGNFISEKFEIFCKKLNIEHTTLSSHHHQNNGKVETCIKHKMDSKKCSNTNSDTYIA